MGNNWRNIWNEAKNATELLVENRAAGETCFDGMIQKYGGDAMIFYQWALAYEIIGEKVLALEKYKIAKDKFPLPRWKQKAQYGIDRIENELLQENDRNIVVYEKTAHDDDILDTNSSFTVALDAFSKIIDKYGKEILASENNQKLKGLVADLFPYRNELCPILKQALSCDFTKLLLDCDNNNKKELAIKEAVEKIVEETDLEKSFATLVVKLITLSLGWDLEKNYEEDSEALNSSQSSLDENNSQNSTSQNEQPATDSNKKMVKKFLIGFIIVVAFFLVLIGWNNKEFLGYRIKAGLGNPEAQNKLGNCYYNGDIVEQDYNRAVYWYEKSAEQGYANAQSNIGVCYYNGYGVEQDYEKAFQWFVKSAEQGNADAQCNLGACYGNGLGVEKNLEQAFRWFEKSAEQGHAIAQCNLGTCYSYGDGVEQNYEQAKFWFKKSAEQGYEIAQKNLKELGESW